MALRFAGHSFLIHKLEQRFITVRFQSVVKLLKKKKKFNDVFSIHKNNTYFIHLVTSQRPSTDLLCL